jgi:hypothetical protein
MLSNLFSLLFSVLLTVFALAPWFVDQTLRFLMAKEVDVVMIVLTMLSMVSIALLVQDLGSQRFFRGFSGLMVVVVMAAWLAGVCLSFWTGVEPLWQRTVPGVIFALASLWLPVMAWMPFWSIRLTNRVAIVLALLLLQPFFVLRYKIQPLNPQGQFVVVKRSDLYRQMASNASPIATQSTPPVVIIDTPPAEAAPKTPAPQDPVPTPPPAPPTAPATPAPVEPAAPASPAKPTGPFADWNLSATAPAVAELGTAPTADAVRINIKQAAGSKVWDVEWSRPGLVLNSDQPLEIAFRAKANPPRQGTVRFQQAHAPWKTLGLDQPISIEADWKEFRFASKASSADENARLTFQFGGADGDVMLDQVAFQPGGPAPSQPVTVPVSPPPTPVESTKPVEPTPAAPPAESAGPFTMNDWTLINESGYSTAMAIKPGNPGFLRVMVPNTDPASGWKVMLVHERITLESGKTYEVKIRARVDKPRSIRLATSQNAPPWKGMGLYQSINLTSDWAESSIEFKAFASGPCRFYAELAGPEAAMDFSSITLTEKK